MASAKAKIRHVFGDTFSCRAAPPDILVKLSGCATVALLFLSRVKCTECGLVQLFNRLSTAFNCKRNAGSSIYSLLFEDKEVHDIYKTKLKSPTRSFKSLDDDSIMGMLLTVETTVCFNKK